MLAELRDPPPDDALRAAAEVEGVRFSLLSDYDLTGGGAALGGTLVLGYGSLADESCASVGETLKRVCTAAWESSVRCSIRRPPAGQGLGVDGGRTVGEKFQRIF